MINVLLTASEVAKGYTTSQYVMMILMYVVVFGAIIYFMLIRPQKKQQKTMENLHSNLAVGDSIVTTSGFYGTVLDVVEDTVIVEFGNNKNCRIPMKVEAIAQIEKPEESKED